MPNRVRVPRVPDADRAELDRRARSNGPPARVVEQAQLVLLAADGLTGAQIAGRVGCTEPTVINWRGRYAERGLAPGSWHKPVSQGGKLIGLYLKCRETP